jgi:hypothetical protein
MPMFLFHTSRVVDSTGAADAMPALLTRMSRPPYSATTVSKAAATWASFVTSHATARTRSAP